MLAPWTSPERDGRRPNLCLARQLNGRRRLNNAGLPNDTRFRFAPAAHGRINLALLDRHGDPSSWLSLKRTFARTHSAMGSVANHVRNVGNSDHVHGPCCTDYASMVCLRGREAEQRAHARQVQLSDLTRIALDARLRALRTIAATILRGFEA